jgi:molecular chaperone DnaK (HSP70)
MTKDNNLLGKFELMGIPPGNKGSNIVMNEKALLKVPN